MNNLAIAKRSEPLAAIQSLDDLQNLGTVLAKSGFFADTRDAAQAIVKVMAGAELGFPPIASMAGIYIVKGRITLSANLIASAIKRSGKYDFRVRQITAEVCEIEFFETGQSIGVSSLTMAEAKAANLHVDWDHDKKQWKDKPAWKSFPRNMLYARAMSNGAKWFCPDIFGGPICTPDELGATVDGETGEAIDLPGPGQPPQVPEMSGPDNEEARFAAIEAEHAATEAELKKVCIAAGKRENEWSGIYNDFGLGDKTIAQKQKLLEKWREAADERAVNGAAQPPQPSAPPLLADPPKLTSDHHALRGLVKQLLDASLMTQKEIEDHIARICVGEHEVEKLSAAEAAKAVASLQRLLDAAAQKKGAAQ